MKICEAIFRTDPATTDSATKTGSLSRNSAHVKIAIDPDRTGHDVKRPELRMSSQENEGERGGGDDGA